MKSYQVENDSEIIIQRYRHCAWWGLVHWIKPCALSWNELSKKKSVALIDDYWPPDTFYNVIHAHTYTQPIKILLSYKKTI